jgi:hypothetical protein
VLLQLDVPVVVGRIIVRFSPFMGWESLHRRFLLVVIVTIDTLKLSPTLDGTIQIDNESRLTCHDKPSKGSGTNWVPVLGVHVSPWIENERSPVRMTFQGSFNARDPIEKLSDEPHSKSSQ